MIHSSRTSLNTPTRPYTPLHTPAYPFTSPHVPTHPCSSPAQAHTGQVRPTVIEGQGHQMGDAGWEQSVMGPLRAFLDALT